MLPTPLTPLVVEGREFFIKRDDLFDTYLSGNKFRKLYTLLQTPKETYHTIISYGGTQSNAMLALAALCKEKGWHFHYYTKPLSKRQKLQKQGNFHLALQLGMCHFEIEHTLYETFISSLRLTLDSKTLVVDQGGASSLAQEGLRVLAKEVRQHAARGELPASYQAVATPSGTGTTALFLAQALPEFRVYTTPVIGDAAYLQQQMLSLVDVLPKNLVILSAKKKYHFGSLYAEHYKYYTQLGQLGVVFDLLYAPVLWQVLLTQTTEDILYIHSGGVSGNNTMLERYKAKFQ